MRSNPQLAVTWFEKAAQLQNPDSMFSLANCYHNGIGVEKNKELAKTWFRNAADLGHFEAKIHYELIANCNVRDDIEIVIGPKDNGSSTICKE